MNNQIVTIAHTLHVNKGAFALLLGSGISSAAGIPTGWSIMMNLIRRVAVLEDGSEPAKPEEWYLKRYSKAPDYSDILQLLTRTPEERQNLLRPFIEPTEEESEQGLKQPTLAHRKIARLAKEGYIRVILTTNFDRLMEIALADEGVQPTVISNPSHIEGAMPLYHSKLWLVKINGDYLDTRFKNIHSELEHYDELLAEKLKEIFENFGLITCGWSAQWDTALVDILKSANRFRFSNFLTHRGEADNALKDLSLFRQSILVRIADADNFFRELTESVESIDKIDGRHPLTVPIAVSLTKKYISKDDLIISFFDLLNEEARSTLLSLKEMFYSGPLEANQLDDTIKNYFEKTELLCHMFAIASHWGGDRHQKVLLDIIKNFAREAEIQDVSNYSARISILQFPALILRYICGIGYVSSNKYSYLKDLAYLKIKGRYEEYYLHDITNNWKVIEKDFLNAVYNTTYLVPMSELLFKKLEKYCSEIIFDKNSYDSFFDEYEFIHSLLVHMAPKRDRTSAGRFFYKNRSINNLITKEINEQSDKHYLIKSQLFNSVNEVIKVIEEYNNYWRQSGYFR